VQNYGPDHGAAGNGVVVVHSDPNLIEHGFISHEMGHAFVLPHSWSANPDTVYGDGWDIMSWDTGTSPTSDFRVAFEGAQGTAGPGLNLRNIQALGLLPKGGKWTPATTNFSETIYLHPLNQHHVCLRYVAAQIPPTATNPVRPSNSTFTVEYRHKAGPDAGIPQDAVLIHEIRGNGLSYLQPTWGSQLLVGQQFITPSPQVFIKVLVIDTNAQVAKVQISSPATVPNLLRKSWSLARATARAAGFGTVTTGSKPGAVTQPIVDTQSPAAGSTAAYGSDISVHLSFRLVIVVRQGSPGPLEQPIPTTLRQSEWLTTKVNQDSLQLQIWNLELVVPGLTCVGEPPSVSRP